MCYIHTSSQCLALIWCLLNANYLTTHSWYSKSVYITLNLSLASFSLPWSNWEMPFSTPVRITVIEDDRERVKILFHPIVKASKLILSDNGRPWKDPKSNSTTWSQSSRLLSGGRGLDWKKSEVMRKPKLNSEKLLSQSGIELPPGQLLVWFKLELLKM